MPRFPGWGRGDAAASAAGASEDLRPSHPGLLGGRETIRGLILTNGARSGWALFFRSHVGEYAAPEPSGARPSDFDPSRPGSISNLLVTCFPPVRYPRRGADSAKPPDFAKRPEALENGIV